MHKKMSYGWGGLLFLLLVVATPQLVHPQDEPDQPETPVQPPGYPAVYGQRPRPGTLPGRGNFQYGLWERVERWRGPKHVDPDDPHRHRGVGEPLVGTSWRNRPVHIGWFTGGLFGDDLISGRVGQGNNILGGYRLGWDYDHYYGLEMRFGFANLGVYDTQDATNQLPDNRHWLWDISCNYYPWGDTKLRPFFSLGMGLAAFRFEDDLGRSVRETLFHLPLGIGAKYYFRNWLTLRCELMNNIAFGSDRLSTMGNVSLSFGVEVRGGDHRTIYYPYQ